MKPTRDPRPLIAHVVYRFDVGGLENGVVNLINHMPADRYRHAVVALADITNFKQRVQRKDVVYIELKKRPGHGFKLYPRLYRLFREMQPAIVHTRNLAALEATIPAWAAGVPVRIHGEHGRDANDLDGSNRKYQWVRRLYRPFVSHYIALSQDLANYLSAKVGVVPEHISQIYNGVDVERFSPRERVRSRIAGCPFTDSNLWIVGTVGRMESVKDQLTLARAFIRALELDPSHSVHMRLIMIGDGPLRAPTQALLSKAGVEHLAWLPGERTDIPEVFRALDCFVLPSRAEGISNTILEAMASGLPIVATRVGGNAELIEAGSTGELVPAADHEALARKIALFASDPEYAKRAARRARLRAERLFSLEAMVSRYQTLYDRHLGMTGAQVQSVSAV
jgi:sugar transferase (PEP-CTERM/EpsH1 system associated)